MWLNQEESKHLKVEKKLTVNIAMSKLKPQASTQNGFGLAKKMKMSLITNKVEKTETNRYKFRHSNDA